MHSCWSTVFADADLCEAYRVASPCADTHDRIVLYSGDSFWLLQSWPYGARGGACLGNSSIRCHRLWFFRSETARPCFALVDHLGSHLYPAACLVTWPFTVRSPQLSTTRLARRASSKKKSPDRPLSFTGICFILQTPGCRFPRQQKIIFYELKIAHEN